MSIPYQDATTGAKARDEITKLLRRFGCESVGFMDNFAEQCVILAFTHRGRPIELRASAKGWAALYLRENPHTYRHKKTRAEYERAAMNQGLIAVNSILRDWVKGQVVAVECGILSFEEVFLSQMMLSDGRRVIDHARNLLPAPKEG
jgi:hypothetical protein